MDKLNDLGIDELLLFTGNGITDIAVVDAKGFESIQILDPNRDTSVVVIYGRCSAGEECHGIHGVAFDKATFANLLLTYYNKYRTKTRLDSP